MAQVVSGKATLCPMVTLSIGRGTVGWWPPMCDVSLWMMVSYRSCVSIGWWPPMDDVSL